MLKLAEIIKDNLCTRVLQGWKFWERQDRHVIRRTSLQVFVMETVHSSHENIIKDHLLTLTEEHILLSTPSGSWKRAVDQRLKNCKHSFCCNYKCHTGMQIDTAISNNQYPSKHHANTMKQDALEINKMQKNIYLYKYQIKSHWNCINQHLWKI